MYIFEVARSIIINSPRSVTDIEQLLNLIAAGKGLTGTSLERSCHFAPRKNASTITATNATVFKVGRIAHDQIILAVSK